MAHLNKLDCEHTLEEAKNVTTGNIRDKAVDNGKYVVRNKDGIRLLTFKKEKDAKAYSKLGVGREVYTIKENEIDNVLEEAKNVDVNDITTHPFFKKHFSKAVKNRVYDSNGDEYVSYKIGKHEIRHYPVNHKYDTHIIEVGTHASRNHDDDFHYYGSGQHKTAHTALESAIKQYKDNVSRFKPLTESLVNKKPATAAKLFAEEMETRLDEISKKTLGRYIERAVVDRDRHIEDATRARASVDALNNVRADSDAASQTKRSLRSFLGDQERTAHNKKYKRETGILKALNRLTKEDLDEEQLNEISKKTLGKYTKKAITNRDDLHAEANHLERLGDQMSLQKNADSFYDKSAKLRKKYVNRTIGINKAIDRLTKEDLDEVEAPANFWNAGMARMNPIQVSQKQPAEPGQFKATLTKSPKRLADQDSSLEGKPRAVRDETEATATSRGPKTIELTGDWHADVPDHQFDPKLDSETEYYPLFSQFKSLGAYPSGPARTWESEEIDEDELNEISKKLTGKYVEFAIRDRDKHIEDATKARASADALQNVRTGTNYVADDKKRDLRDLLGVMERKAHNKKYKRERGIIHALNRLTKEDLDESRLDETEDHDYAEGKYAHLVGKTVHSDRGPVKVAHVLDPFAFAPYQATDDEGRTYNIHKGGTLHRAPKFQRGRKDIKEDLNEDSASLMATATKDEKKAAEQDKKKPAEFKKLHDKHEAEVKSKMKELGEEALNEISKKTLGLYIRKAAYQARGAENFRATIEKEHPKEAKALADLSHKRQKGINKATHKLVKEESLEEGLFDPAKQPLLALWDEHARRSDAHGSGSRNEILKRIEDHVAKKHGQEGLKKMKLHTDLTNALKHSLSPDKGHLQAILGNMRSRCAMGV